MRWLMLVMFCCAWNPALGNDSPLALQETFMAAMRANDADAMAVLYTADATNFPVDSMAGVGPDSVRSAWGGFFANYRVIDARLTEKHMEVMGDTAVAWGLFKLMVEPVAGGDPFEMTGRYMDVARNFEGEWMYIADHASVPAP